MKDTLFGIVKKPQAFVTRMGQARWRSVSSRDPLERRVAKLQTLSMSAQQFLLTRTAPGKLKTLTDVPVGKWSDVLKDWDPEARLRARDAARRAAHAHPDRRSRRRAAPRASKDAPRAARGARALAGARRAAIEGALRGDHDDRRAHPRPARVRASPTANAPPRSEPMAIPLRYTLAHGPVIAALGRVAMSGSAQGQAGARAPAVPSPWIEARLPPRPPEHHPRLHPERRRRPGLVQEPRPRALLPGVGLPARRARARRPRLSAGRGMNAGCRDREPGAVARGRAARGARPHRVDRRRRQARHHRAEGHHGHVACAGGHRRRDARRSSARRSKGEKNEASARSPRRAPTVPADAHEIAFLRIPENAGLDFAKLTGDFNPDPLAGALRARVRFPHGASFTASRRSRARSRR